MTLLSWPKSRPPSAKPILAVMGHRAPRVIPGFRFMLVFTSRAQFVAESAPIAFPGIRIFSETSSILAGTRGAAKSFRSQLEDIAAKRQARPATWRTQVRKAARGRHCRPDGYRCGFGGRWPDRSRSGTRRGRIARCRGNCRPGSPGSGATHQGHADRCPAKHL